MLTLTPSGAGAFFLAGAGYPNSLEQKYAMNEQMIEQQSQHYEAVFPPAKSPTRPTKQPVVAKGVGGALSYTPHSYCLRHEVLTPLSSWLAFFLIR